MKEVYIVSAVRTPMGSFGGTLAGMSATQLGAVAIKGALERIKLDGNLVNEVLMGCVMQANLGQAPARQAAKFAGLPDHVSATTINKVCASGLKAVSVGAQSIMLGDNDIVVAGGMESMSQVPFYLDNTRWGAKYGNGVTIDGLAKDGLVDVYSNQPMGSCAETCAKDMHFTREDQDNYAMQSYKRSAEAWAKGNFANEIVPVTVKTKKGDVVFAEDEEYKNVNFDKIPTLKAVFAKEGTITAANASTMNDGAAALVLMSKEKATELGLKPLAIIRGYADAEQAPEWFTTSPSLAVPKAVKKAGLNMDQVNYFELHEAFSVVALANMKLLNLDPSKVNVNGGAVALGHPLGASGARILVSLINILKQNNATYGAAAACNGGGGASAMVIENVN
jgi:acetyl-CoA C-acetyltransferase